MTRRHLAQLCGGLVLALATPPLGAEEALAIRVTPHTAFAPATVSVTVTVEPDADNRTLLVEDDSDQYFRSSLISLEGDQAARTYVLVFRGLPPGQHRIVAVVRGSRELRGTVRSTVTVIGSE